KTLKAELITDINKLRVMRPKTRKELKDKASDLLQKIALTSKECKSLLKNLEKLEKEGG
ncbi:MAG: hypothetical protein HQK78_01590, partial [Desulfobacterales bacterium]|nr:hypothetical protein [Desulfobacterales bacterium]